MGRKKKNETGALDDAPFSYQETADGKVFISWNGRQITILRGDKATAFLKRVSGANEVKQQLAMARAAGNFKRGNERS